MLVCPVLQMRKPAWKRGWPARGRQVGSDRVPPALSPITHPLGQQWLLSAGSRKIRTEKEGPLVALPAELRNAGPLGSSAGLRGLPALALYLNHSTYSSGQF